MRRYLISQPDEAMFDTLADALDLVDFGIVLFDSNLRICFINRLAGAILSAEPATLAAKPTFRELIENAAANGWYDLPAAELPAYLDAREAEIRSGSGPPTLIELADRRQLLYRCTACANGGRIMTYADITGESWSETADAIARISAEQRFTQEILENQAANLASLAEAATENAQKAEAARILLEHEIAERRMLEMKLRQLATTDGLTGALNRSEMLVSAQRVIEVCRITNQAVVVLMIDVDHFKAINDRFGHAGGDRALQNLTATLRAGVRQVDLLGRLGGEEFAIVLTDTSASSAEAVAERLCARVAEAPVLFGDRLIPMTISIGMAVQLKTETAIEQVLARADDALYRAKGSGRNRVVSHQGTGADRDNVIGERTPRRPSTVCR